MDIKMMTAKEYAKHVGADVRTVRRWMRNGLLKFTPPPENHPHHACLIDSDQPRPENGLTKSIIIVKQNVKPSVNVTRQADKRSPNVTSRPSERKARLLFDPDFEMMLKPSRPEPIERKSVSSELVSNDDKTSQADLTGIIVLFIFVIAIPVIDYVRKWFNKLGPEQRESPFRRKLTIPITKHTELVKKGPEQSESSFPEGIKVFR